MRLFITLLLSTSVLLADISDRLPNTKKAVPVRAPKRAAGSRRGVAGNSQKPGQPGKKYGAIARALSRNSTKKTRPKPAR